jgi:hypothetical protein
LTTGQVAHSLDIQTLPPSRLPGVSGHGRQLLTPASCLVGRYVLSSDTIGSSCDGQDRTIEVRRDGLPLQAQPISGDPVCLVSLVELLEGSRPGWLNQVCNAGSDPPGDLVAVRRHASPGAFFTILRSP